MRGLADSRDIGQIAAQFPRISRYCLPYAADVRIWSSPACQDLVRQAISLHQVFFSFFADEQSVWFISKQYDSFDGVASGHEEDG